MNIQNQTDTIIFDLGAVLIDWNPRHLYRKIFKTEEEITWFLENICTHDWNEKQDAGRSFEEATEELLIKFPEHEHPIRAWYDRWQETISGPIQDTVDILKQIKERDQHRLYALTTGRHRLFHGHYNSLSFFTGLKALWFLVMKKPESLSRNSSRFYLIAIR